MGPVAFDSEYTFWQVKSLWSWKYAGKTVEAESRFMLFEIMAKEFLICAFKQTCKIWPDGTQLLSQWLTDLKYYTLYFRIGSKLDLWQVG